MLSHRLSVKGKVLIPSMLYLLTALLTGALFFSSRALLSQFVENQQQSDQLLGRFDRFSLAVDDYLAREIHFAAAEDRYRAFVDRAQGSALAEESAQIWTAVRQIDALRNQNAQLKQKADQMADLSIKQSNGYIQSMSDKLADPIQEGEVSVLERQVIAGANINTCANYDLKILFEKLQSDPRQSEKFRTFIETSIANAKRDVERLQGTPFAELPQEALRANLKIRDLGEEFIRNLEQARKTEDALASLVSQSRTSVTTDRQLQVVDASAALALNFTVAMATLLPVTLLGCFLALRAYRSIAGPVSQMTSQILEASEQVSTASREVAQAAHVLASGTSSQAASLEQTSASLEQISATSAQNADHANQANALMRDQAAPNFAAIERKVQRMKGAISETLAAGEETAKIIKTIDEIAFQTNILALNAAVEAARAGEAGMGFSVVADEVRSLADRAAEAAKTTDQLINRALDQIRVAAQQNGEMVLSLEENARIAQQVSGVISQINAGCNEQALGIGQISQAVQSIDQVTQEHAASAEQSASASEELSAQATQLRSLVLSIRETLGASAEDSPASISTDAARHRLASPGRTAPRLSVVRAQRDEPVLRSTSPSSHATRSTEDAAQVIQE